MYYCQIILNINVVQRKISNTYTLEILIVFFFNEILFVTSKRHLSSILCCHKLKLTWNTHFLCAGHFIFQMLGHTISYILFLFLDLLVLCSCITNSISLSLIFLYNGIIIPVSWSCCKVQVLSRVSATS